MLKLDNEYGSIIVEDSVVAAIVSTVANHCFGVAGMTAKNMTEELWSLFRKDSQDKGIHVTCEDNEIDIDLHIMVTYGINIPAITDSIVHKVAYTVEDTTGFKVNGINVYVDSINTK